VAKDLRAKSFRLWERDGPNSLTYGPTNLFGPKPFVIMVVPHRQNPVVVNTV
jgi:hypothetical protein